MQRAKPVFAILASWLLAQPASAHHSFAAVYDLEKPVTVTGVVTRVEWLNPHAAFYLNVENEAGGVDDWAFELASPNGLMRLGWTRSSLQPGDTVTVEGFLARDGSRQVNTRSVTLAGGKKMFTGARDQGGLN